MSAAFLSVPAFRKASIFCGPGGNARASSRAAWACASRSIRSTSCLSGIRFVGMHRFKPVDVCWSVRFRTQEPGSVWRAYLTCEPSDRIGLQGIDGKETFSKRAETKGVRKASDYIREARQIK